MRTEESFNFTAQRLIACTGRVHKSRNLLGLLIQRRVKDFLNCL